MGEKHHRWNKLFAKPPISTVTAQNAIFGLIWDHSLLPKFSTAIPTALIPTILILKAQTNRLFDYVVKYYGNFKRAIFVDGSFGCVILKGN